MRIPSAPIALVCLLLSSCATQRSPELENLTFEQKMLILQHMQSMQQPYQPMPMPPMAPGLPAKQEWTCTRVSPTETRCQ